jgi:hypothetical protein
MNKDKKITIINYILIFIVVIVIFYLNFERLMINIDTDYIAELNYGRTVWNEKNIFPENWVYANELMFFRPALLFSVIYGFTGKYIISYALALSISFILILLAFFYFIKGSVKSKNTVLLSEKYIDNEEELMIANSDQYVDIDINSYIHAMNNTDGLIMTMTANDPKWSFIQYDEQYRVTMVKEKEVISNEATVGIYNFKHGKDYVKYAHQMIEKEIRVNGEFYVAPVYNEMIADGKDIKFYNIGRETDGMYGLGIPQDLERFLNLPISKKVFGKEV